MMFVVRRTRVQHALTGIEADGLGNSVNMQVPVGPIDSRSTGLGHRLLVAISSAHAFTRNGIKLHNHHLQPIRLLISHVSRLGCMKLSAADPASEREAVSRRGDEHHKFPRPEAGSDFTQIVPNQHFSALFKIAIPTHCFKSNSNLLLQIVFPIHFSNYPLPLLSASSLHFYALVGFLNVPNEGMNE
ncbi:unnamed protein product [Protopolystoma xenopodis]|uniref:Uncharacterized protein n=1 Tax=Protopolystoma xenopodis TaxID=117903 RepID=A0A3S4ZI67_9PLAT|nr:unnamed protein product [Protopolystoma xenopodis]